MPQIKRVIIWVGIIAGAAVALWLSLTGRNAIKERDALRDKVCELQEALAHSTIELQRDTIRDSIPVAKQSVITIDKTDYKKMEADRELIRDLKLKIEQVESENRTLLATYGHAVFKTAADSDSILRYKDRWAQFTYLVKQKMLFYQVRDSVTTIVSRIPKHHFLFWRWGTKGYAVTIVNHNPNASVEYSKYIKVEH